MEPKQDVIPFLQIGKNGVTESFITEVKNQLKKSRVLKVRMLKSALEEKDRKEIAAEVAEKAKADLLDVRGHTFTLKKR
jgi:RNA-binding protein